MRGGFPFDPDPPAGPRGLGRKIVPVKVITDADLKENGGVYSKSGGAASDVIVLNRSDLDDNDLASGPVMVVFSIPETSTRHVKGGKPIRVVEYADLPGRPESGHIAIPIRVISGSF